MATTSIHWFRRDLRLVDNLALNMGSSVIPIFIFTPEQITNNEYMNMHSVRFMIESLVDLDEELRAGGGKLHIFYGHPEIILHSICKNMNIKHVYAVRDYTPYSHMRDKLCADKLHGIGAELHLIEDILLHPVGSILTSTGHIYMKFTPFYECKKGKILKPNTNKHIKFVSIQGGNCSLGQIARKLGIVPFRSIDGVLTGGRTSALGVLTSQHKSQLSTAIKFGCISIREVYWEFKRCKLSEKIRQLYWREFYINIGEKYPRILASLRGGPLAWHNKALNVKYAKVWPVRMSPGNLRAFDAWCNGRTGYPLIDVSMQEMNQTGFMHNRGRLLCADFLCKKLFIHWGYGEKYFAQKLIDYDPIINALNWQWVAITQPYFRMFNSLKTNDEEYVKHIEAYIAKNKHAVVPHNKPTIILSKEEIIRRYESGISNRQSLRK